MVENQLYHFGFDECWFDYFAFITTSITFSIIFAILTVIFIVGLFFSKIKILIIVKQLVRKLVI